MSGVMYPVTNTSVIEYEDERYRVVAFDKRKEYNDIRIITALINE